MSTELISAILSGDADRAITLIEKGGADVNYIAPYNDGNRFCATPLHAAVLTKNLMLIEYLLKNKADANILNVSKHHFNEWQCAPLGLFMAQFRSTCRHSVDLNDEKIVASLLSAGADMFSEVRKPDRTVQKGYPKFHLTFNNDREQYTAEYTPYSVVLRESYGYFLWEIVCEVFLRSNVAKLLEIQSIRNFHLTKEALEEYFELTPDRKILPAQFERIMNTLDELTTISYFELQDSISIREFLAEKVLRKEKKEKTFTEAPSNKKLTEEQQNMVNAIASAANATINNLRQDVASLRKENEVLHEKLDTILELLQKVPLQTQPAANNEKTEIKSALALSSVFAACRQSTL